MIRRATRRPAACRSSPAIYKGVLKDIATSLKNQGFKNIFFIADSGGNTRSDTEAAAELMKEWAGSGARAFYIAESYNYDEILVYENEKMGVKEDPVRRTASTTTITSRP